MNEETIKQLCKFWESGESLTIIYRLLPYKPKEIRQQLARLRQNGVLGERTQVGRGISRNKILQAYKDENLTPTEIANELGCSTTTVYTALREQGVILERPKHYKKREVKVEMLCDRTQAIIANLQGGKRANEVAKEFGVTRQYISLIKNKYLVKGCVYDK